ncbi:MAG: hypothetical protein RAP70_09735 [Candidatus Celaenobacter antarcticus]|nr:hypothetical protein [Candidatus Celaenobacter antarcticus]
MKKLTCVFCFEKFYPKDIKFRCINENPSACEYEEDKGLQKYQGKNLPKLQKIVSPVSSFRMPRKAICSCGMETTKMICPICHNELPNGFGEDDNLIIALIGAKEVGKSHYIAVLIHELQHRIGTAFEISMVARNEKTIKRYNEDFEKYIYRNSKVIPATLSGKAQINVRYPLIYKLSIRKKQCGVMRKKIANLVFFDTAGEDLSDQQIMETTNKYISNSGGLIFLLDPLQTNYVRQEVPSSIVKPINNIDQFEIINRVINLIRKEKSIRGRRKIKIPVAVSFSKLDCLKGIIDPLLLSSSNHNGYLDINDVENVNSLFYSYLGKWLGPNFLTTMKDYFKTYSFFGLSALGDSPDLSGNINRGVNPFRIEDPLLWILSQKGFISKKKI